MPRGAHRQRALDTGWGSPMVLSHAQPLVEVKDLTVKFVSREATTRAVNGVTFELMAGEVLCIIGESGSGKSVTLRALMKLLPPKRAVLSGHVRVGEHLILVMNEGQLRNIRGSLV